jgi:16S rRNA (uracil1498-N3)-methyltransferase
VTDPLFLVEELTADGPTEVGSDVLVGGREGHHAAVVRRIAVGERVLVGDGRGAGVRGSVVEASKAGLRVRVDELLAAPEPALRLVVVQALAKGDRSELAVEMLTEVGVHAIVPWQASRSVVRWSAERGDKALARWRSTVREAAKQSRRLRVPEVTEVVSTKALVGRLGSAELALVLHEEATEPIADVALPVAGEVLVVVGPEGGISPDELAAFAATGARIVRVGEHVLRTSTAGVVALSALLNR